MGSTQTSCLVEEKAVETHSDMMENTLLRGGTLHAMCAGAAERLVHLCAAAASLRLHQNTALPVCSNPAHFLQGLRAVHLHLPDFSRRAA